METRLSEIYRLVRANTKNLYESSHYTSKKYTQSQNIRCKALYKIDPSKQPAFCAVGEDETGQEGDPFVIKAPRKNGMTPVYTVAIDANHVNAKTGIFLQLYPYVEWIKKLTQ